MEMQRSWLLSALQMLSTVKDIVCKAHDHLPEAPTVSLCREDDMCGTKRRQNSLKLKAELCKKDQKISEKKMVGVTKQSFLRAQGLERILIARAGRRI